MVIKLQIPLPQGFRHQDFLAFHGRDTQGVSESITGDTMRKGVVWDKVPAIMQLSFKQHEVEAQLQLDVATQRVIAPRFAFIIRHMLGLTQPTAAFEAAHRDHPLIGKIIRLQSGLRVPLCASPFEALTWAIMGQQISLNAAISLRRKLIRLVGPQHRSGLYCYPSPEDIAGLSPEEFRLAGISRSKAQTIFTVSESVQSGMLPMDEWLHSGYAPEAISRHLLAIKGIGPWTVNYTLLRGFGWLDGSLHGDAAVKRAIRHLMGFEQLSGSQAEQWLIPFKPWRAMLAAHLWAWPAEKN